MKLVVDEDVAKVAEFLIRSVKAKNIQRVAHGVAQLADLVFSEEWFRAVAPEAVPFTPFRIEEEPMISSQYSDASLRPQGTIARSQSETRTMRQHDRNSAESPATKNLR
jgi:hypothetical protein